MCGTVQTALLIAIVIILIYFVWVTRAKETLVGGFDRSLTNKYRDYIKDKQGWTDDDYRLARQFLMNQSVANRDFIPGQ